MKIYQYSNGNYSFDTYPHYIGKLHIFILKNDTGKFLCGKNFQNNIDISDSKLINFSKGICVNCRRIYERRHEYYKKDLNFEVVKLKLGIKNV